MSKDKFSHNANKIISWRFMLSLGVKLFLLINVKMTLVALTIETGKFH